MPPQDPQRPAVPEPGIASGLDPGARVEVRNRFDGSWSQGFEVAEALPPRRSGQPDERAGVAYRVRRLGDDAVLNATFRPEEVRRDVDRPRMRG
ncbi:MAG TPA: hypothetical protein VFI47_26065 [Acidimicrobiales bacterium]|nr:hypothetical protein [Acidimicrobiales bacterium]